MQLIGSSSKPQAYINVSSIGSLINQRLHPTQNALQYYLKAEFSFKKNKHHTIFTIQIHQQIFAYVYKMLFFTIKVTPTIKSYLIILKFQL